MKKELIIITTVLVAIVILDILSQNYTKNSISELDSRLNEIKTELTNAGIDKQHINKKVDDNHNLWVRKEKVLSYYIEHDELEKIGLHLDTIKGYKEAENYDDMVSSIEETIFILNHIQDKYKASLKNVF